VLAARAARTADLGRLLQLDAEALARCPSRPLRLAAARLGSQLLRTAAEVWPTDETIRRYRAESADTPRPVAFGVVGAAGGLGDADVARAYLYEDTSGVLAAAVRLVALDSAHTARRLIELEPLLERLAADAAAASDDASLAPGGFAPALELRSLDHAAREGRLFAT
jgi:urease accessory protein